MVTGELETVTVKSAFRLTRRQHRKIKRQRRRLRRLLSEEGLARVDAVEAEFERRVLFGSSENDSAD